MRINLRSHGALPIAYWRAISLGDQVLERAHTIDGRGARLIDVLLNYSRILQLLMQGKCHSRSDIEVNETEVGSDSDVWCRKVGLVLGFSLIAHKMKLTLGGRGISQRRQAIPS
jgi:hypothetical protein